MNKKSIISEAKAILWIILSVLLIKVTILEAYIVPTGSMENTIMTHCCFDIGSRDFRIHLRVSHCWRIGRSDVLAEFLSLTAKLLPIRSAWHQRVPAGRHQTGTGSTTASHNNRAPGQQPAKAKTKTLSQVFFTWGIYHATTTAGSTESFLLLARTRNVSFGTNLATF